MALPQGKKKEAGLRKLIYAICQLRENEDPSQAYQHLIQCYADAKALKDSYLRCETLHWLTDHISYYKINFDQGSKYIKEYADCDQSAAHQLRCAYLQHKYEVENQYRLTKSLQKINSEAIAKLINSCDSIQEYRMASDISEFLAVILEKQDQVNESIEYHEKSKSFADLVSPSFAKATAEQVDLNLAKLYQGQGRHQEAANIFQEIIHSPMMSGKDSRSQELLYGWYGETLGKLNRWDSAYRYQNMAYETYKNAEIEQHRTAMGEIQRKFDVERTEKELLRARLNTSIMIQIAIVLALISAGVYWVQRLRRRSMRQELEATKVKATLDATRSKMEGEQKERSMIASMLHDQVASLLSAAGMHLAVAKMQNDTQPKSSIEKVDSILKEVNDQVRNLSHQLVSPTLMKYGLVSAVDSLAEKLSSDEFEIKVRSQLNSDEMDNAQKIFAYRAISELLNNAMKHSGGDTATVRLEDTPEVISVEVKDNGHKPKSNQDDTGLGLASITKRARSLGGSFSINYRIDGTLALLTMPRHQGSTV